MLLEFLPLVLFLIICLVLMTGYPVALVLAGVSILFAGIASLFGAFDNAYFVLIPNRIYSILVNQNLFAIPLFVFMGIMLQKSRIAEDLLQNMAIVIGRFPGGLGVSVVLVGMLLAASTGIVGATVVTMGVLSLPAMIKAGYSPRLSTGVVCATGTLGQIIPPSICLVLLGEVMANAYQQAQLSQGVFAPATVSIGELFAGAIVPGLLLVSSYGAYVVAVARLNPLAAPAARPLSHSRPQLTTAASSALTSTTTVQGAKPQDRPDTAAPLAATPTTSPNAMADNAAVNAAAVSVLQASAGQHAPLSEPHTSADQPPGARPMLQALLKGLLPPVLLMIAVLGSILGGLATPTEAASVGAAGAMVLAAVRGQLGWRVLHAVSLETMKVTAMVYLILIGATIFAAVFRGLGGDVLIEQWLLAIPGGIVAATLVVMLLIFLLGFILDFIEITFMVVPLVGPILLAMGLDPIWLGIMLAINLQTSFLTPPFGFSLFYLRSVAPSTVATSDIYRGVIPFIIIQLAIMLLLAWQPQLATWLPELL